MSHPPPPGPWEGNICGVCKSASQVVELSVLVAVERNIVTGLKRPISLE